MSCQHLVLMTLFWDGKEIDLSLLKEETKTSLTLLHPKGVLCSLEHQTKAKPFPCLSFRLFGHAVLSKPHAEEQSTMISKGAAGRVTLLWAFPQSYTEQISPLVFLNLIHSQLSRGCSWDEDTAWGCGITLMPQYSPDDACQFVNLTLNAQIGRGRVWPRNETKRWQKIRNRN